MQQNQVTVSFSYIWSPEVRRLDNRNTHTS